MDMKNCICTIAALILLSQALFLPLSASEAKADTRVTITFAAGGVACGFFFFLRFTLGGSLIPQHHPDKSALFDHGTEGWEISIPSVHFLRDNERSMIRPVRSSETVQMELLKFRF